MADGRKILDKSATIKEAKPDCQIMLKTTAPVCSKTLKFLADQGIKVIRDLNSIFAGISSYMTYNGNNAR